jgi:REP element-mobilizing transposase RayT
MVVVGAARCAARENSFGGGKDIYMENKFPQRKSIRLKDYDYSQQGMYFITICTYDKKQLFGRIKKEKMILNKYGYIAKTEIRNTILIRNNLHINSYIIMPNHIHMIIEIECGRARETEKMSIHEKSKMIIPQIIQQFKMIISKRIKQYNINHSIWQRNYYEHIIRNEKELYAIQEYINNNPLKWEVDRYYNM